MPKFLIGVLAGLVIGLFLAALFPDALANVFQSVGLSP